MLGRLLSLLRRLFRQPARESSMLSDVQLALARCGMFEVLLNILRRYMEAGKFDFTIDAVVNDFALVRGLLGISVDDALWEKIRRWGAKGPEYVGHV